MKQTYYLIKVTSTALPNNPSYAGEIHITYYGKNQKLISGNYTHTQKEIQPHLVKTYGYKVTPAKKILDFWNISMNTPIGDNPCYWEYKAETVKIDLPEDTTPTIRPSTNSYNLKARLFSRKYNDIVNTPTYENSSNDRRIAYNLYHIYLRDCAEMEKATPSPTTLPPIITSPSIRCAVNRMLDDTDAELESIVSRMENLIYNHKARSWEATK